MQCKEIEIVVPENSPFKNDLFGLEPFSEMLTGLCDQFSHKGAVLALNGDWGSGKTTFLRMWKQSLLNDGYRPIYFNAWNCDYQTDPLAALLGELDEELQKSTKYESLIHKASRILVSGGASAVKNLLRERMGIDVDGINDVAKDIAKESIGRYKEDKNSLKEFKEILDTVVTDSNNCKTQIILIDELDRCNPEFAVKLLERVKHLFDVPNIIFILALNIEQLQYAIQGFYGSTNINGREYLKRSYDIEINIPKPDLQKYCNSLIKELKFEDFFQSRTSYGSTPHEKDDERVLYNTFRDYINGFGLSLSNAYRLLVFTRLALAGVGQGYKVSPSPFFILIFLKFNFPEIFKKIETKKYYIEELLHVLEDILPQSMVDNIGTNSPQRRTAWGIAQMIFMYNYHLSHYEGRAYDKNFKSSKDEKGKLSFPILPKRISKEFLFEALKWYEDSAYNFGFGFTPLLNRISLLSYIQL